MALLHLLRFGRGLPQLELVAAHFDHRMRPESREDALWVEGLARAWNVPVEVGGAEAPMTSEEAAREARYAFLEARAGPDWRTLDPDGASRRRPGGDRPFAASPAARASRGCAGIPARRGVILRPLLSFWREELEAYVRSAGACSSGRLHERGAALCAQCAPPRRAPPAGSLGGSGGAQGARAARAPRCPRRARLARARSGADRSGHSRVFSGQNRALPLRAARVHHLR